MLLIWPKKWLLELPLFNLSCLTSKSARSIFSSIQILRILLIYTSIFMIKLDTEKYISSRLGIRFLNLGFFLEIIDRLVEEMIVISVILRIRLIDCITFKVYRSFFCVKFAFFINVFVIHGHTAIITYHVISFEFSGEFIG